MLEMTKTVACQEYVEVLATEEHLELISLAFILVLLKHGVRHLGTRSGPQMSVEPSRYLATTV